MTENEVSNLTSSMNALTKQMEKMSAQQLMQSKNINDQKKDFEDIFKNAQGIETSERKQNKYLSEMKDSLSSVLKSTLKISSTLTTLGTAAFTANVVKDLIDIDNKMTALSVRMGKGHEGIKGLKKSVHDLQKDFGASYENALDLVETLAKNKYVGNITKAAAGINLFSRASGVSSSEIAELTINLSKMGGLGTNTINAIYTEMTKVQQSVGMSEKSMNALVRSVNDMAFSMAAFGKSSVEIKAAVSQTTALVGAMEKVGIEASRSTQLINQLLDPDKIEDNMMLYSQLGISIQDAISGDIDKSMLGDQFKEMADRITAMGPIAGSSFARSMGISYKEVTRMAKMEAQSAKEIADAAATPEEQALDVMKNLEKSTEGIGKQFETTFNKLEGSLKSMPTTLLLGFALAAPLIINLGKKIWHKIFSKKEIQASVADTVVPALTNGFKKAGEKIKGGGKVVANAVEANINDIAESKGFKGIDKKIDKLYSKATKTSARDRMYSASSQNLLDSIEASKINAGARAEGMSSKLMDLGVNINSGGMMNSAGMINIEQLNNSGMDNKKLKSVKAIAAEYNKMNKYQLALTNQSYKEMGLKGETLKKYQEAQKSLKEQKSLQEKQIDAQNNINAKCEEREKIQERIDKLTKDQNGLSEKQKEINGILITQLESQRGKIDETLKGYADILNQKVNIADAQADVDAALSEAQANKPIKGGKLLASAGNGIKQAWNKTAIGRNIAMASVDDYGNDISGKQKFGIGAKTVGGAALKGIGKTLGGIAKSVGPMALVMSIFGRLLSRIKEPLESAMNTIVDSLSPIIEAMMPAIQILMNVMAKSIMPLVLNLLSGILKVVHFLLKPVIGIFHLLGKLPGKIGEAAKGIGDAMDAATGPQVTEGLKTAATKLSETSIDLNSSSKNLDDAVNSDDGPTTIQAMGGSMVAMGTTSTASYTNESTGQSAEEKLKEEEEYLSKKKNEKNMEGIDNNTSVLPKILSVLQELVSILTNNQVSIFDESSTPVFLEEKS